MKFAVFAVLCCLGASAETVPSADLIQVLNEAHARERAMSKRCALPPAREANSRRTIPPRVMGKEEREQLRQALERLDRENPGVLIDMRTGKPFESPAK